MKSLRSLLAVFCLGGVVTALADSPKIGLRLVVDGLTQPLSYSALPDGRALVVDQIGQVRLIDKEGKLAAEPVLDLTKKLSPINLGSFDERGVLCLALHPKFAINRRVFLTYTAPKRASAPADWDCTLRLSEFQLPAGEPLRVDPASEIVRLEVDKPYNNHNGGRIAFGPEGMIYMSVGDGGNANDEGNRPAIGNGQNTDTLLGKILRLDVETPDRHSVPLDNPYIHEAGFRPEIWAYGLRNVWGMSFDRGGTHQLFAADVGQDLFEEVDIIVKGGNYGWHVREGFHPFDPKSPKSIPATGATKDARGKDFIDPIFEYRHTGPKREGEPIGISITGGYVYRGKAIPSLAGRYVFGDWSRNFGFPQGLLISATPPAAGETKWTLDSMTVAAPERWSAFIVAFGEDNDGELYVLTNQSNALVPGKGRVWKIVPAE
jgi:glucose/arabinose dehydrogenase